MDERSMTYGERAVGLTFNPSGDPNVNELKRLYAKVIDHLNYERLRIEDRIEDPHGERYRLLSVAITEAQGAQMWAVKAATWED